jgi:hypothetical protein
MKVFYVSQKAILYESDCLHSWDKKSFRSLGAIVYAADWQTLTEKSNNGLWICLS